jgi:mannose-6-phosphate isomerase-like protein (cupin superfamily)
MSVREREVGLPETDERLFIDPYLDWTAEQGVPVVEDYGVDLLSTPTKPWAMFDTHGAIVHLKGRGDFVSVFLLDLQPGAKTSPQQHLYEEIFYVIEGHGSTQVEIGGKTHSFEWGPRSMFALPLNARYRLFNGSGRERALLASCNYFPMVKNLFRSDSVIFDRALRIPEREYPADYLHGEGRYIPIRPGWNSWETNFVEDVGAFELKTWNKRGAGSASMNFILADGVMKAHVSSMPVGSYKKGHRHGPDFSIFSISGSGYSLFWYEGDEDFVRVDWKYGMLFAPPEMMWHQHFNSGAEPARYLAVALGGIRYPFLNARRKQLLGVDVSAKDGGGQVEYYDQDPRIHQTFLNELAEHGAACAMDPAIFNKA